MAAEKAGGKERVYFRGLQDISYSLTDELKRMRDLPRVIKSKDLPRHDITGPNVWSRWVMEPDMKRMQSIQSHMVDLAPGGRSQKHGHMNEAVFYIVDGEGYDIHDGKRFDYEAGDIVVVYNGCVHQHFNKSQDKPLKTLVVKTKPMFLFMNLLFQSVVERAPKQVVPGFEDWKPVNF